MRHSDRSPLVHPWLLALASAAAVACSSSKKPAATTAPDDVGDAATTADSGPKGPPPCSAPTPVTGFDGSDTGFVNCSGGTMHRTAVHACPSRLPRTTQCGFLPTSDSGVSIDGCHFDSDCTTKAMGYCTTNSKSAGCYCDYGCTQDSDCGPGKICQCADPVGKCVAATCTSDADCGGLLCLRTLDNVCGNTFACQKPTDPCTSNTDCPPMYSACTLDGAGRKCEAPALCR